MNLMSVKEKIRITKPVILSLKSFIFWVHHYQMNNMDEINNLIAIQSAIQLKEDYKGLDALIDTISDLKLAQEIINEVKRRNFGNISSIIDTYLFDNNQDNVLYKKNDIKQFDFSYIEKCNTKQIKKSIGVFQLPFYQEKNREGFDTGLYSHWDSLSRFAVLIDKGLAEELKKDPELLLNLTKELLLDELGYYTSFNYRKTSFKYINS